jgi:hypothetical protein
MKNKQCQNCGEVKPCIKEYIYSSILPIPPFFREHIWVCKECYEAKNIIYKKQEAEELEKQRLIKLNWVKERDKLLKNTRR